MGITANVFFPTHLVKAHEPLFFAYEVPVFNEDVLKNAASVMRSVTGVYNVPSDVLNRLLFPVGIEDGCR